MFQNIYDNAKSYYDKNGMAYHNWNHVVSCLNEFEKVKERLESPESVEFAILFHDAIYNPIAKDNEKNSADLARRVLEEANFDYRLTEKVGDLILATKHIEIPENRDSGYIVDVDLSILGKGSEEYLQYANAIRKEYFMFSDKDYNIGRAGVMQGFLNKARIFSTEFFQYLYEVKARDNIRREIDKLGY